MREKMRLLAASMTAALVVGCAVSPAPAVASFGFKPDLDVTFSNEAGEVAAQAGSHPFAMTTTLNFNTIPNPDPDPLLPEITDGAARNLKIDLPPGQVAAPTAVPSCDATVFLEMVAGHGNCPNNTVLGRATVEAVSPGQVLKAPVYSLAPAPGEVFKLGLSVVHVPVTLDVRLNEAPPYNGVVTLHNIAQTVYIYKTKTVIWGDPTDPAHDSERGTCWETEAVDSCPVEPAAEPFLTLPRACTGPLATVFSAESWTGDLAGPDTVLSHDDSEPPNPQGMTGCDQLGLDTVTSAQPTTQGASSPTGLDFNLDVNDPGLTELEGIAGSDIKEARVVMPEGMTANPSVAEGLEACSKAQLAAETASSAPGEGCPDASKVGTVEVETPLLDESLTGSLFVATPYDNEAGSLIALYMVIKNPKLGVSVKQTLRVDLDPATGRITTVAENLPQLPFSHFRIHLREGDRSPLATPPTCGEQDVEAILTPWAGGVPVVSHSTFSISSGPDNGACAGSPGPFAPAFLAGTTDNTGGHYSPFLTRLTRNDGEQEFSNLSFKLPRGLIGKLAGIPYCSDAAIAAARARTGSHGGAEEEGSPSCPDASKVGHTLVGAGVGPSLTYATGSLYLAGPYNGSPFSLVAITPAKVGPFDLGTVVVRLAVRINPETAEVSVDSNGSDPLPRVLHGIPVHLRDIRAYVDRPDFILNPTSCNRMTTGAAVFGAGPSLSAAPEPVPVSVSVPFQAAGCSSLGFKPRLALSLKGGIKRGKNPALKAVLTARGGDANIGSAQVGLPHSEFLEQGHIRTICTRVQFAQGAHPGEACPKGSVYGRARAVTPLLSEPLEGPVFLRSSSHPLPDLVAALHNQQIDIVLDGRIDSTKRGGIRNTFEAVPDAPVSKFVLEMQGGKKGLLVNSTNICRGRHRATARLTGQNGKVSVTRPNLKAKCPKRKHRKHKRSGHRSHGKR